MIILRSETNKLFKEAGLEEITLGTNGGRLTLVTKECGQVIFSLPQMYVGSSLTAKTRAIIIEEYIKPMLEENVTKIKHYISSRKDMKKKHIKADESIDAMRKIFKNITYNTQRKEITISFDDMYVIYNFNGKANINTTKAKSINDINKSYQKFEKHKEAIDEMLLLEKEYHKALMQNNEMSKKLNSICSW